MVKGFLASHARLGCVGGVGVRFQAAGTVPFCLSKAQGRYVKDSFGFDPWQKRATIEKTYLGAYLAQNALDHQFKGRPGLLSSHGLLWENDGRVARPRY